MKELQLGLPAKQIPLTQNPPPPPELDAEYEACRARPTSDISLHMPLLRELAAQCAHVTEFGVRGADGSTVALLAGQPETMVSWDCAPAHIVNQRVHSLLGARGRTLWYPRVGDSLSCFIEETDLLFIDTYHSGKQLFAELNRHGWQVRKWIVCHDTFTFGWRGEDGREPGLLYALREFQQHVAFPIWQLKVKDEQQNGLVVLERVDVHP